MRPILPVALVLATALVATIVWEMQDPSGTDAGSTLARAPTQGTVRPLQGGDKKDIVQGWMTTTLERPLFRDNRRPAKVTGDPARTTDEPLRLTGVITGPFGNRAIFLSAESPKPIVVQEGALVDGFVVRTIQPGFAVLEGSAGNVQTLKPSFAPGERTPKRSP